MNRARIMDTVSIHGDEYYLSDGLLKQNFTVIYRK